MNHLSHLDKLLSNIQQSPHKKRSFIRLLYRLSRRSPLQVVESINKYLNTSSDPLLALPVIKDFIKIVYSRKTYNKTVLSIHRPLISSFSEDNLTLTHLLRNLEYPFRQWMNIPGTKAEEQHIFTELQSKILALLKIETHYQQLQEVIFPVIEKSLKGFIDFIKLEQQQVLDHLKQIILSFNNPDYQRKEISRNIGKLYNQIEAIIYQEETLLYPVISLYWKENNDNI